MRGVNKIILILILCIIIISSTPIYSNAFGNIIKDADSFLELEDSKVIAPTATDLQPLSNFVSGVLLSIAIGVTLISAILMGINFVVQSVEEKAKIKESMVPWIIGIFVSFGAFGIWRITMSIFYEL